MQSQVEHVHCVVCLLGPARCAMLMAVPAQVVCSAHGHCSTGVDIAGNVTVASSRLGTSRCSSFDSGATCGVCCAAAGALRSCCRC
jgi:hypothetical protein